MNATVTWRPGLRTASLCNADETATAPARYDIYRNIHKALRAYMNAVLVRVGAMDTDDEAEMRDVLKEVREMLNFCLSHLEHEDRYVHAAMEALCGGASARTSRDHRQHIDEIRRLEAHIEGLSCANASSRSALALNLYRHLALFVAENMEHMHVEETENNGVLWAYYSDAEIHEIETALVSSIPPETTATALRWMVPHLNPTERASLLRGMRDAMPSDVFSGILATLEPYLDDRSWDRLMNGLGKAA